MKPLVAFRRKRNSFAYPKIRTGASTVQWTVDAWETQLGGLPKRRSLLKKRIPKKFKSAQPSSCALFSYKNYDKSNRHPRQHNRPNRNRHRLRRARHCDDILVFFLTTLYQKANGVSTDFNSRLPSQASSAMFSVLPWSPRYSSRPLLPARRVPQSRSTRRCPARRSFSRRSYQSFGRRP